MEEEFPKDIDLVVFADYKVFQEKEKEFEALRMNHKGVNKRLDIYPVEVYSKEHKKHFFYESDKMYWLDFFSHTKKSKRTGKRQSRGFIKIIYNE